MGCRVSVRVTFRGTQNQVYVIASRFLAKCHIGPWLVPYPPHS